MPDPSTEQSIAAVRPISAARGETLATRDCIARLVEAPLLEACCHLCDLGIQTHESGANGMSGRKAGMAKVSGPTDRQSDAIGLSVPAAPQDLQDELLALLTGGDVARASLLREQIGNVWAAAGAPWGAVGQ